ncbi:hypothetical protein DSO57_1023909 [Entomophthora muscae]|uniref:Uncharacterized protein n=1 Tax=Entomophthora muscae TaxID=34485 RepID=A0ACC2T338_9FUNG|nr:hypothetical protein DSO57_1023909 [Entomophthora muscae]
MTPEDLQTYTIQLEQVNLALSQDPDNAELLKLREDIHLLINLTKTCLESQASAFKKTPAEKEKLPVFEVGDQCMAKWAGDGVYYQAVVSAKTEVGESTMYSVVFVGYNTVELFKPEDLKHCSADSIKPEPPEPVKEAKTKKKRKPNTSRPVGPTRAETEQKKKQDAWLKFAKKSKVKAAPINQKSIFSTPDNPNSKVGVVNSGKPMTQFNSREKHQFPRK